MAAASAPLALTSRLEAPEEAGQYDRCENGYRAADDRPHAGEIAAIGRVELDRE